MDVLFVKSDRFSDIFSTATGSGIPSFPALEQEFRSSGRSGTYTDYLLTLPGASVAEVGSVAKGSPLALLFKSGIYRGKKVGLMSALYGAPFDWLAVAAVAVFLVWRYRKAIFKTR